MGKRILVVDDDAMNLKMAEFMLKQKQYEVIKAESGMQCLEILQTKNVDLILLDVEMPVMSGISTLKELRNLEAHKDTLVMLLTGTIDEAVIKEAEALGIKGCIKKPFLPQALWEQVEGVL